MSSISDRIKEVRKKAGLTQQKFADRIGAKQNTVAQYEIGRNVPIDPVITSICREFRVSEKWLRTGEGQMEIAETQRDKLNHFFADVLTTAPDERSAFVAALDDLPAEFWPLVAQLVREYADNLKDIKKED
jgi:transcriptional regulator with XRE-family HTH domain